MADRNYVVSSLGGALVWVGVARSLADLLPRRPSLRRVALGVAGALFAACLLWSNVVFQGDWARSAADATELLHAVDRRFDSSPPAELSVGPAVPSRNCVRSIHQFFLEDASRVVLGHPLDFRIAEHDGEWRSAPPDLQLSWEQLLGEPVHSRCE